MNLLTWEPRLAIKLGLILVIIIASLLLIKKQGSLAHQLKELKEKQKLVAQIPEFEKQIRINAYFKKFTPEEAKKIQALSQELAKEQEDPNQTKEQKIRRSTKLRRVKRHRSKR